LFLIALTGFFPVAISTFRGVQGIEPVLIRAAQSMDIGQWTVMSRVILPACMPDISTGLRVGWTLSIAALVGAEMIAARSGVGFMIMDAMNNGRFDTVIFGILLLGLFSVSTDYLFSSLLIGRLLRWHAGIEMA
jgi:NitT/TauT family transport system permease protein